VSAIVICFLATIYPSRQAPRLDPVQALRFECSQVPTSVAHPTPNAPLPRAARSI